MEHSDDSDDSDDDDTTGAAVLGLENRGRIVVTAMGVRGRLLAVVVATVDAVFLARSTAFMPLTASSTSSGQSGIVFDSSTACPERRERYAAGETVGRCNASAEA